jgi:cytochrome c-type biogenesis protein CcmE
LIFSIVLSLLNFIFAFIGIGFIIILPLFIYTGVFYAIYRQILNDKKATSYKTINIVGLVITLVWLTLDFIIFG